MRKMKLSFLAMLCGWIACNIALSLAWVHELKQASVQGGITSMLFYGLSTGVVILAAWLVIFLPVDLLIPDHSMLRRPWPASICGFLAGSSVVAVILIPNFCRNGYSGISVELLTWKALLSLSLPGITGMVAAYVRSRHWEQPLKKP